MTRCTENPNESTKILLELTSQVSSVTGHKINTPKSTAFIRNIMNIILFKITMNILKKKSRKQFHIYNAIKKYVNLTKVV